MARQRHTRIETRGERTLAAERRPSTQAQSKMRFRPPLSRCRACEGSRASRGVVAEEYTILSRFCRAARSASRMIAAFRLRRRRALPTWRPSAASFTVWASSKSSMDGPVSCVARRMFVRVSTLIGLTQLLLIFQQYHTTKCQIIRKRESQWVFRTSTLNPPPFTLPRTTAACRPRGTARACDSIAPPSACSVSRRASEPADRMSVLPGERGWAHEFRSARSDRLCAPAPARRTPGLHRMHERCGC